MDSASKLETRKTEFEGIETVEMKQRTINLQKPILFLLSFRDIQMSRLILQSQLLQRDRNLLPIRRSRRIEPGMLPSASYSSTPVLLRF